jgi:hypothetical protein
MLLLWLLWLWCAGEQIRISDNPFQLLWPAVLNSTRKTETEFTCMCDKEREWEEEKRMRMRMSRIEV